MLNCRQVAERASTYVEHEGSFVERLQMGLHLLVCRACRQYVQQVALTRETLRAFANQADVPSAGARDTFRRWKSDARD